MSGGYGAYAWSQDLGLRRAPSKVRNVDTLPIRRNAEEEAKVREAAPWLFDRALLPKTRVPCKGAR